jgi:Uma2 family endonuclease
MSLSASTIPRSTLDDLLKIEGKAELIGGSIVHLKGTGFKPSRIAAKIFRSLDDHAEAMGIGFAFTDNIIFAVPELRSGRESFSPEASYYIGLPPANELDFIPGPPTFAVEVQSKGDYGNAAEVTIARKRADYFEAGTLVVWDVDIKDQVIRSCQPDSPEQATEFRSGQEADANAAVEGWRIAVDSIFR